MRQTPKGWPRISPSLYYDDAAKAIEWLCQAFGFTVRLRVEGEGGRIEHSELTYGEALIIVCQSGAKPDYPNLPPGVSPSTINGGNTQSILLFVDDVDSHCAHAKANGALIIDEPKVHDYGEDYWTDRTYGATDIEGHLWWITQRLRDQPEN